MARHISAEDNDALARREVILTHTVSILQQTINRQNELIQCLLADPPSAQTANTTTTSRATQPGPAPARLSPAQVLLAPSVQSKGSVPDAPPISLLLPSHTEAVTAPTSQQAATHSHPRPLSPSPEPPSSLWSNHNPSENPSPAHLMLDSIHPSHNSIAITVSGDHTPFTTSKTPSDCHSAGTPASIALAFPPFPRFGTKWLPNLLRWWWYPKADHGIPNPLREWALEQRRATAGEWRKIELIARGWHIMKGHELKRLPMDQVERPDVTDLPSDVDAWRLRWGDSQHEALIRIRVYLRDHQPVYEWAPRKGERRRASLSGHGAPGDDDESTSGEAWHSPKKAKVSGGMRLDDQAPVSGGSITGSGVLGSGGTGVVQAGRPSFIGASTF